MHQKHPPAKYALFFWFASAAVMKDMIKIMIVKNFIQYHKQKKRIKSMILKVATFSKLPLISISVSYFFLYLAASSDPPVADPLLYE